MERALSRGEPRTLPELVAWFREALDSETPMTLHKGEVWRDYGQHASGGSLLGTPAWSEPFRRFIAGSEHETDVEGYFIRPLRAALARFRRQHPLTSRHLVRLALAQGDLDRHAANIGWSLEEVEMFMSRALFLLWKEWAPGAPRLQ